jgi:hypothetical protein
MPWPIVNDAVLTAVVLHVVIAVSGHFIGFIGRHWGGAAIAVSGLMGFIFGVWANPIPALSAAAGGSLVAGSGVLAGAIVMFFIKDAKVGTLLSIHFFGIIAGALCGAIGSSVGRSVFGS